MGVPKGPARRFTHQGAHSSAVNRSLAIPLNPLGLLSKPHGMCQSGARGGLSQSAPRGHSVDETQGAEARFVTHS